MSKFIINGPAKLSGRIAVKGAKNAALKIIPAALLASEPVKITNLPKIEDIERSLELSRALEAETVAVSDGWKITAKTKLRTNLPSELAHKIRTSIMFAGPLLAKQGQAEFPLPGGCSLASGAKRPIDLFLEGFKRFGAVIRKENGRFKLSAKRLKGCNYFFTTISVTGTECLMMTAVLARGRTILKNCAQEPEITFLADTLNAWGARINGAGTPTITIDGVGELKGGAVKIMPDRLETGTFAIMAAATGSELEITDCQPEHVEILLMIFDKINVGYTTGPDWIKIKPSRKILAHGIKTHEYPGFPTDLQSPYTVLMTQARGASLIHETIYDRRLLYVDMLMQMGADIIMCDPHRVVVNGPTPLIGRKLVSPDIRAGIAMLIAALAANGLTEIDNIYQIDRGYEKIDARLKELGADIKRIL